MNVYFVNPTYVKPEGWKPLLDYLKVKAAYSFIPKEELPESLYTIIKPYLKTSYSNQDMKKFADNCVYWLRAHFEKHISLIPGDYEAVHDMPKEERLRYSSMYAFRNLKYLDEDNCIILIAFKTYIDYKGSFKKPQYYVEGLQNPDIFTHITQYCLNILHKKYNHYKYHNQSAFIIFDEFFSDTFYYNAMKKEWYYYYVKSRRGSDINFMSVVRVNINFLSPNVFPIVEDNGKRYWTPLITQEGNKLLDQLICEAELARKQYNEEQRRFDDDGPSWQEEADELNRAFWRECGDAGSNCESWPGWD